MTSKHDATKEGVADAFAGWLYMHDVSVPDTIHDAISKEFRTWLSTHSDELTHAIAVEIAKRHRPNTDTTDQ
jgi:hypothetical protein